MTETFLKVFSNQCKLKIFSKILQHSFSISVVFLSFNQSETFLNADGVKYAT